MSSLSASIKRIGYKTTEKRWQYRFFPIISQWALSVAMETGSNLSQNLMQSFPYPNDASYKIWSTLANWPQRYSSFIWIMTEWQNHRIPEGQGKSSIAPIFSKQGYKYVKLILILLFWGSFIVWFKWDLFVWFLFYGPSTHFRSFRAWSVNLATLFLGKPPKQFTST